MTVPFNVTIEQRRSGARLIKLEGDLDGRNRLRTLGAKIGAGTALIHLSGVERIDANGARDWMKWLATLEAKGIRPALLACSPAVVAHLNRDESFARHAIVKSFQVPYHCAACERDKLLLVHLVEMGEDPRKVPGCSCDGCGALMTCTEDPEEYLLFIRRMRSTEAERAPRLARGSSTAVPTDDIQQMTAPRVTEPEVHREGDTAPAQPSKLRYLVGVAVLAIAAAAVYLTAG